jgi:hypothetical protein
MSERSYTRAVEAFLPFIRSWARSLNEWSTLNGYEYVGSKKNYHQEDPLDAGHPAISFGGVADAPDELIATPTWQPVSVNAAGAILVIARACRVLQKMRPRSLGWIRNLRFTRPTLGIVKTGGA